MVDQILASFIHSFLDLSGFIFATPRDFEPPSLHKEEFAAARYTSIPCNLIVA